MKHCSSWDSVILVLTINSRSILIATTKSLSALLLKNILSIKGCRHIYIKGWVKVWWKLRDLWGLD